MAVTGILTGAALAVAAAGEAAWQPQPDLSWLGGYWLSCEGDREVAETWSARVGGIQIGYSITSGDDAFFWEQMRIESNGDGPSGLVFRAQPRGAAAVDFRLLRASGQEAVFENKNHDFPQRVIYRRDGDRLIGRIEGVSDGKTEAIDWEYRAAPLNSHCPTK